MSPGTPRGPSVTPPAILAQRPEFARSMVMRRVALGLTQHQLAEKAGIAESSIAAYEIGGHGLKPGPNSRRKIMQALGWTE